MKIFIWITDIDKKFTMVEKSSIIKYILKALNYIHNKGIVHRDVKPGKLSILVPVDWSLTIFEF